MIFKKIKIVLILIIIVIFVTNNLFAQSGITLAEFTKRLQPYFNQEMIDDVVKHIDNPDKVTIWGWDVGDFSGDGNYDVAFVVKILGEKKSVVYLNLFVDMQGYLVKVGDFPVPYLDLPLEVGTNIKEGSCFVSQKIGNSNWKMYGYKIEDGALIFQEDFSSKKLDNFTVDEKNNYFGLQVTERVFENDKGFEKYNRKYFIVPSYNRGRLIFRGFTNSAVIKDIDFVNKGAFYWQGEKDSYFEISSAFDNEYLYFQITVYDDNVTQKHCDYCEGDYISLWFNTEMQGKELNRFTIKGKQLDIADKASNSIYNFQVFPGDFVDIPPFVNAFSNDLVTSLQQISASQIKTVSNKFDGGYTAKIRIPFELIGLDPFLFNSFYWKIAFTAEIHDIDNEYRPEEETVIATSQFVPTNPSTYGTLNMIPNSLWYGDCRNIYKQDISQTLLEYGF
ncbi:MAG: hypothetical protein A2X64_05990 [Ignavibacteria bacterium GWF2_33_9]|nr:MAG: hypothetical protein A2X64_05990 [Ignavibacteria bacterium GWF2_33_9]